jgi:hypothetical protein
MYRLGVPECKVLRRIGGPKPGSNRRKGKESDNLYSTSIKGMIRAGHEVCLNGRSRHRWDDNIKMALKEIGYLITWTGFI